MGLAENSCGNDVDKALVWLEARNKDEKENPENYPDREPFFPHSEWDDIVPC